MAREGRARSGAVLAALIGLLTITACSADPELPPPPPVPEAPPIDAGAVPLGNTSYQPPPGATFVSPLGNDALPGTEAAPLRTLAAAVQRTPAGGTIVLRDGTYRESVQVYGKALTIQPYPGEAVWLSGSDVVGTWLPDGGDWRHDGWTPTFGRANVGAGPIDSAAPLAGWPEMAFLDGRGLRQVASRGEVGPGTFFVDDAADQVYLGDDPTARTVELSSRPWALYFNRADSSVLRGIGIRHHATPLSQLAAVRAYSNRLRFENVVFDGNAVAGVSVIGSDTLIRSSTFRNNGQLGVHGNNADGLVLERNYLEGNNAERFDPTQTGGAVKVTRSKGLRFTGNQLLRNQGKGFWTDQSSYDITITTNLIRNTLRHGIHVELSAEVIIADNVVSDSGDRGIAVMESNDVDVWNNTLLRNGRNLDLIDGPRTSADTSSDNHDRRFPTPDPRILWQLQRVTLRNNVIVGSVRATNPLLRVDDAGHTRSADSMEVTSDHNAFYRPTTSSPAWVALWSQWPSGVLTLTTLADLQNRVGQERNSVTRDGGTNPWVTDEAGYDYRVPTSAPGALGAELPASVAEALGRPAGVRVNIGALTPVGLPST
jgi:parallel beta-helix repeat protein